MFARRPIMFRWTETVLYRFEGPVRVCCGVVQP
jgi:hypothetical protein